MAEKISVAEKQELLRQRRSGANKIYAKAQKAGFKFRLGAGKGLEPKDQWCECHNRAPCPIAEEIGF